jgi:hypothetical protein
MNAKDLLEVGDTFVGEYRELTVLSVDEWRLDDTEVKVETLGGTVDVVEARELIEMVSEKREPVTLD